MKKLLILGSSLLLASGLSVGAMAQPPHGHGMYQGDDTMCDGSQCGAHGRNNMMSDLNLSDAQRTQVRDIMTQSREDTRAKVRAVLTPEQQTSYDSRISDDRRGGHRQMMRDLNLSDAQRTQISDIMTQSREDTHAKIRSVLTPEQQATFDNRAAQRKNYRMQRQPQ